MSQGKGLLLLHCHHEFPFVQTHRETPYWRGSAALEQRRYPRPLSIEIEELAGMLERICCDYSPYQKYHRMYPAYHSCENNIPCEFCCIYHVK